jgi:hypothetical protein
MIKMKLFVYYVKSGTDVFNHVERVCIKKRENKNTLIVKFTNKTQDEEISLNQIKSTFLIKIVDDNCEEYFRYEK